jgi:hypothetical protein
MQTRFQKSSCINKVVPMKFYKPSLTNQFWLNFYHRKNMTDVSPGISFKIIDDSIGHLARNADQEFEDAMQHIDGETTTQEMQRMQKASQEWAFKLETVAKAYEKLGDTLKSIVQKS